MADDIEVTTDPIIFTPTKRSAEEYATKTRELLESFKKGGGTEAEFKKTENYKILKEAYIEASKEEGDLDSPVNKFEFSIVLFSIVSIRNVNIYNFFNA